MTGHSACHAQRLGIQNLGWTKATLTNWEHFTFNNKTCFVFIWFICFLIEINTTAFFHGQSCEKQVLNSRATSKSIEFFEKKRLTSLAKRFSYIRWSHKSGIFFGGSHFPTKSTDGLPSTHRSKKSAFAKKLNWQHHQWTTLWKNFQFFHSPTRQTQKTQLPNVKPAVLEHAPRLCG